MDFLNDSKKEYFFLISSILRMSAAIGLNKKLTLQCADKQHVN
jgi:hypothetical protein